MSARKIFTYALVALPASGASARSLIKGRQEACEAELLIDDFSQWEDGLNLLEGAAGRTSFRLISLSSTSIPRRVYTLRPL